MGSRSSYSTAGNGNKERRVGKKLSFSAWALRRPSTKTGQLEKRAASAVQAEDKPKLSPPVRLKIARKTGKKTVKEAQTVLQLITGLNTIYLPFTNLSWASKGDEKQVDNTLPNVSSKDVMKLKGR